MSNVRVKATRERGGLVYRETDSNRIVSVFAPIVFGDDFLRGGDFAPHWLVSAVNSGTATALTASAADGGIGRITTGAADDDDVDCCSPLLFNAAKMLTLEFRVRLNDVAHTAFNVGFTDTPAGEAADAIPITFATASATTNTTDAAMFFLDADATSNVIRAMCVKNNVDSTITASSTTPADAEWFTGRIEIDPDGTTRFRLNDVALATVSTGMRSAVNLCAALGAINREGAANTFDIDYLWAWQDRR